MKQDQELVTLLNSLDAPEYIRHHFVRITTCISFLRTLLNLKGLKTLDLGHDTYVGMLLNQSGVDLTGNIAPREFAAGIAPPEQPSSFQSQDGQIVKWSLDAFDFEGNFPYPDSTFELVTALEVIEHVVHDPRAFVREIKRVLVGSEHLFI